jgi:ech hydrogenase subunit D
LKQEYTEIESPALLDNVKEMKEDGYRLVQICCTRVPDGYELTYSFDKEYNFCHLRLTVPESGWVMSITSLYWSAFIYENEMHDLFGLDVRHIANDVDYKGTFYRLSEKAPWHTPPKKPAPPVRPQAKQPPVSKAAPAGEAVKTTAKAEEGAKEHG